MFYQKANEDGVSDSVKTENTNIFYLFLGIFGVCFLIFLCMYKRIKLAIGIIKTAALFTKEVKSALVIPFL